jgi:protein SCO1/2
MLKTLANKKTSLVYSVVIAASLGLGVILGAQQFSGPASFASGSDNRTPIATTSLVAEFALENHRGEIIGVDTFRDHWSLVFFGFTSCPDYCPLELQRLAKVLNVMGAGKSLQVVFVSVDPERDAQEKLAAYVSFFHPQIIGARGSNVALAQFAQFFGAAYDRSAIVNNKVLTIPAGINLPTDVGDQYQVNHSTRVFIVNPAGAFAGSFAAPYEVDDVVLDMQKLMER